MRLNHAQESPEGIKALGAVHDYVAASGLSPALINLVYLRVSQINGCAYCINLHSRDLLKAGMDLEKLVLVPVWKDAGQLFTSTERAALAWAENVADVATTRVPDHAYSDAVAVFGEKGLSDLTIAIGLIGAYNRLSISFRIEPTVIRRAPAAA